MRIKPSKVKIKAKKEQLLHPVIVDAGIRTPSKVVSNRAKNTVSVAVKVQGISCSASCGEVTVLIENMKKTFENKELAKKVLIASGVYDKNLKLTPSFKR